MVINNAHGDEQILTTKAYSGAVSETSKTDRVQVTLSNATVAPMEETNLKLLLEITGAEIGGDRLGVDIVAVLDITGISADRNAADELKTAMKCLINKLSPIDCLSILTFSESSVTTKSPWSKMTDTAKLEIEELVENLVVVNESVTTNAVITGLHRALKMLNDRKMTTSRASAIMVVTGTSELQSDPSTALQIPDSNVPVFTFSLSPKCNAKVLYDIASKSMGGIYVTVDVEDTLKCSNQLAIAFSQCLVGLLKVVVPELKLSITSTVNSKIKKVFAREYSKSKSKAVNSVTISFGNLNCVEKRKVIIDLLLPAVLSEGVTEVLQITYSYSIGEEVKEGTPLFTKVTRTKTDLEQDREEVTLEATRLNTASVMKKSMDIADSGNLDKAQDKIVDVQNKLEDVDLPKHLTKIFKKELYQFIMLLQLDKLYQSHGRAFALATLSSHDRQGFAQVISYDQRSPIIETFPRNLLNQIEKLIKLLETMQDILDTFR